MRMGHLDVALHVGAAGSAIRVGVGEGHQFRSGDALVVSSVGTPHEAQSDHANPDLIFHLTLPPKMTSTA